MARILRVVAFAGCVCFSVSLSAAPRTVTLTVVSEGQPSRPSTCGGATFLRNGVAFYSKRGCIVGGGRGFNVAAIDQGTGDLREPARNFDTWYDGAAAARAMIEFIDRQPIGTVLLIAVGDEGGLTVGATAGCPPVPTAGSLCCRPLAGEFERLRQSLEGLGAAQIRRYCYWNSYALIAVKGIGAMAEQSGAGRRAVARYGLT